MKMTAITMSNSMGVNPLLFFVQLSRRRCLCTSMHQGFLLANHYFTCCKGLVSTGEETTNKT